MAKKTFGKQFIEQRLWDIFLARCLLRNPEFLEEAKAFAASTGIHSREELEQLMSIYLSSASKEVKKKLLSYWQFQSVWKRDPCFNRELEDKMLSNPRILERIEPASLNKSNEFPEPIRSLIPRRAPVRFWEASLSDEGYLQIGIDRSARDANIKAEFDEFLRRLREGEKLIKELLKEDPILKQIHGDQVSEYSRKMRSTFVSYCKRSILGINEMFRHLAASERGIGASKITTRESFGKQSAFDDPKFDPKWEARRQEIQSHITFIKNCINNIKKLISPHANA
jgi:hypothetical protein